MGRINIQEITAPTDTPASGYSFLFVNSATGFLSNKKSDGTTNVYLTSADVTLEVARGNGDTMSGIALYAADYSGSYTDRSLVDKAYVDSLVGGSDTLAEILANGNTTDGTDIIVSGTDSVVTAAGHTGTLISANASHTTASIISVSGPSLTLGNLANFTSSSSDTSTRNLVQIQNLDAAATGTTALYINQLSTGYALDVDGKVYISGDTTVGGGLGVNGGCDLDGDISIDCDATTGNGVAILASSLTTGQAFRVTAPALSTGSLAVFYSNVTDTSSRYLVQIVNDEPLATGATSLYVQQDSSANGIALSHNSTSGMGIQVTTQTQSGTALNIDANSLTSGRAFKITSNSTDTSVRVLAQIINDNSAATGARCLQLQQDAATYCLYVDQNADGNAIYVDSAGNVAQDCIVAIASNLTTGSIGRFYSNASNTSTRNLIEIINDDAAATGTTVLYLQQDSTGDALNCQGNVDITGKLTVSGLIDPTGLVLDEQSSSPASPVAGKGVLWVKDNTPNTLTFTDDAGTDFEISVAANTYIIRTSDDLDALAVSGTITISSSTQLIFENVATITTTNVFVVTAGTLYLDSNGGPRNITYTGAGTFFTLSGTASLDVNEININGATTGLLFSSTCTGQIEIDNSNFTAWDDLGAIVEAQILSFRNVQFIIYDNGLDIDVPVLVIATAGAILTSAPSTPWISFTSKATTPILQVSSGGTNGYAATAFYIDPDIPDTSKISFTQLSSSGNAFDTSGSTGTFTAVADGSISSTSITSVTSQSGIAQFNYSSTATHVNQEVVISGFTTNTDYNGTFIITATDGSSWFTCRSGYDEVEYGSDETGSFTVAAITITSTAHGLQNGDTLTIDTDNSTDYDGGATVYASQTNTFQINRTYTSTHTGSWDTNSLDQSSKLVTVIDSGAIAPSRNIGSVIANGNTTVTTISTANTWTDINLGAVAEEGSNIELWKLLDTTTGEIVYTGVNDFYGIMTASISFTPSASTEIRFRVVKNDSPTSDAVEISYEGASNDDATVPYICPITAETGDEFRLQINNVSATSSPLIKYLSVMIQ